MQCPNSGRVTRLCLIGGMAIESRGATVLESSTGPCLQGSITRPKSTALPKTVKPWHPFSQLSVPKTVRRLNLNNRSSGRFFSAAANPPDVKSSQREKKQNASATNVR